MTTSDMNDNYIDRINEAIDSARKLVNEDYFYNGSIETQNKAYRDVCFRMLEAEAVAPKQWKGVIRAIRNGVLAEIVNAGEEVRHKNERR